MDSIPYDPTSITYSPPWKPINPSKSFPVIYSILAPEALVLRVLCHYEMDSPQSCQFWRRGLSDVYVIETRTKCYVLRVSHQHWRTKSELDFELEFLMFLANHDIPVAYPVKTRQGNVMVEINAPEGKRYASLFPYAPGEVAVGDLNLTQSCRLGETLARLHQVSRDFDIFAYRKPLNLEYLLDDSLGIITPFLDHNPEGLAWLLDVVEKIKQDLAQLPQESPYWSVCWGDPHSGNVHFTPDNQLTLFDFDQCGYGWRMFDIGKFWQLAIKTGLSRKIREALLESYQTVEQLTDLEIQALQPLTQMAYIWSWSISVNASQLYDYSRLDRRYFRYRLQSLKSLESQDWQLF